MAEEATDTTESAPAETEGAEEATVVTLPKAEADALRRELAEARKAAKRAEKSAKDAADAKAVDEGKWKELAEQRGQEAEEAKRLLADTERKRTVASVAKRLNFIDADDAFRFLDDPDLDAEGDIERELKRVVEQRPHLVGATSRTSGPVKTGRANDGKADMNAWIRGEN